MTCIRDSFDSPLLIFRSNLRETLHTFQISSSKELREDRLWFRNRKCNTNFKIVLLLIICLQRFDNELQLSMLQTDLRLEL